MDKLVDSKEPLTTSLPTPSRGYPHRALPPLTHGPGFQQLLAMRPERQQQSRSPHAATRAEGAARSRDKSALTEERRSRSLAVGDRAGTGI
jgi:hypothetical protein